MHGVSGASPSVFIYLLVLNDKLSYLLGYTTVITHHLLTIHISPKLSIHRKLILILILARLVIYSQKANYGESCIGLTF